MIKSEPLKFKQFDIVQAVNPQKVGTDSMLLGAWTSQLLIGQDPRRILDIGTGTGILALMMAQSFPEAEITAIEPHQESLVEAERNFRNSQFSKQIMSIQTSLQDFASMEKFDLIICNPPYFDGTYLSESDERNKARHTSELSISELYKEALDLLAEDGKLQLVIPQTELTEHLERAYDNELYLQTILHSIRENGERKRAFLSIGFNDIEPDEAEILVKDSQNNYSDEYISLTKAFYKKEL